MVNNKNTEPQVYYPPPKRDTGLIMGSIAVLGIAGVGAYYLYTRDQLIKEYVYWAKEYQREYEEAMDEYGEIPPDVQEQLNFKTERMKILEHAIMDAGLIGRVVEALKWTFGIIIGWTVYKIVRHIMNEYLKKHPPPGSPPGEPYYNPVDNIWHPTEDDMIDHIRQNHPAQPEPQPLETAWFTVLELPQWILDFFAENVPNFATTVVTGWENTPEPIKLIVIGFLLVAICLLIAFSLGSLYPTLEPSLNACKAACA